MRALLCVVLLFVSQSSSQKVDYSNYKIVSSADGSDLSKLLNFKQFERVSQDGSALLLDPSSLNTALRLLQAANVNYRIVTQDLQKDIELEATPSDDWFSAYHRHEEILKWLDDVEKKHPNHTSLIDIGKSYEGRVLRVLKLTGKKNKCKTKPAIWIDSGIHSREWITHTTNTYLIDRLLKEYDTDEQVREIRDSYDWYFLVTMNPDGYEFAWDVDRLWRKSRKPTSNKLCVGTDINRNFDHKWNQIGSSNITCSQSYAGPNAFSESEGKAVADFIMKKFGHWDIFTTIHSYGHYLLTPWGYTKELPPNYADLESVGNATVNAIRGVHGLDYTLGASAVVLYPTSGTNDDWAYGVAKIPYSYTFELRDQKTFVLPPSEIIPTGEEIWAGVKAMVSQVIKTTPPQCKK